MTNKTSSKNSLAVVILAAGKGTRMKSALPKVMHKVAGRPMINWVIERAESLNPEKIIVVIAPDMDEVAATVAPHKVAIQKQQNGTGDAVKPAMELLAGFDGKVLILLGDEPFVDIDVLEDMIAHDGASVMGVVPPSSDGLGRMMVDEAGNLEAIIEERDASDQQKEIGLCNAGNFCFPVAALSNWLDKLQTNNNQKEYYLTDVPLLAREEGVETKVFVVESDIAWGINNRIELSEHEYMAQAMLRDDAMMEGVTFIDPESVTLSWDTEFGQDVTIEPNVILDTGVTIGNNVTIHAFSHIKGADIEDGASIGPFARIRPKSVIGEGAAIGNFCEVNRSIIEPKAKSKHFSYIGDSVIGENTNIGAGTVIANYDGFFKHKSTIGKNVFIGSNATLISPVNVGDAAIIAANSTINKDVPGNAMAVARSRQENHAGWASEYRNLKRQEKEREEDE
jgi:bifunctional UDP-N-acetylglucosamine pyrophosphorylase/glucosamine-1-phosphate N-acetyltransferase